MSGFHDQASAAFDSKARLLVERLPRELPSPSVEPAGFFPDVPISGHFTDADIQGISTQWQHDGDGQEIRRLVGSAAGAVHLEGSTHDEFWQLAESIHRVPFMRDSVSMDALLGWLGEWLLGKHLGQDLPGVSEYVSKRRGEAVRQLRVLVPLCEPFIQSPFSVGRTELVTLTRAELEEWFQLPADTPPQHREAGARKFEQLRKNLQARTAVVVDVEAEPEHAGDVAWTRANLVASALRLLSKGTFYPRAGSNCVPLGLAIHPKRQLLTRGSDGSMNLEESLLDPETMGRWTLDDRMIRRDQPYLMALASLFDAEAPTDFQRDLLRSMLLYSRAAISREVPEKLVHIFAALESLLLRSESEPVQSAISERVAFVAGDTPPKRAEIAKSVKHVYGLRSKFVHHGRSPESREDINAVKALQMQVWIFFFNAVEARARYSTKTEFIDAIELRKWQ